MQSHPDLMEYAEIGKERNISAPPFQLHADFFEKNPDFMARLEAAGQDSEKIAAEYRKAFGPA